MRLGTLLLRDAIITLTQLEQSLRAQVLSGGRLGTNLVGLGFIDLNTLGRYLARSLDLPLAIADRCAKADPEFIEKLGAKLADRHSAIPLGIEKNDPQALGVVFSNPTDRRSITALEEHFGLRIQPYVAAEMRLFYYLERYYGIRRRTRFTRRPKPEDTEAQPAPQKERRSTQPFRSLSEPAAVSIAPRKHRESAAPPPIEAAPKTVLSLEEATDRVDKADQRDQIAGAIMQFSIGRFECAALFMVRYHHAIGWLSQAAGLGEASLDRLNIPLSGTSIFQVAHDTGQPYRGPVVSPEHPNETELWNHFALEYEPTDLHLVPVLIGKRVVNLLYAHSLPGTTATDGASRGLISLAGRAEQAYRRIISSTRADRIIS
ncbi:MAG: hypothetical protein GY811_12330 [Myxococcales bacterium]|nr:hypothetical protein [Myxococcales bacterium]